MRAAATVCILILAFGIVWAGIHDNTPQLSAGTELGGGGASTVPADAAEGLWSVTLDVFSTTGSVAWIAFTVWPQDIAHITTVGTRDTHVPRALHVSSRSFLLGLKNFTYGLVDAVQEFIRWASLPAYFMRHILEQLPVPRLPWESGIQKGYAIEVV